MSGAAIEVRAVTVDGRLTPTSLDIAPGTVTALIGRNGAGKSTLLQAIAGELRHAGSVAIAGRDIARIPARELARLRAVLDQDPQVAFGFTVREVVSWGRDCWRGTERVRDDDAVITAMLDEQGIATLAQRRVSTLSGGERQRVHLARVRAQQAPVLLLDEADAELDLEGRYRLDEAMRAEASSGTAVVIVSHDIARIAGIADRIIALDRGAVVADGPAGEVAAPGRIAALFGIPR